MRLRRTAVLVLALTLAGCKSGDDPTVEAGGSTTSSSGATTAPSTTPPATVAPVAPPVSAPASAERAYLTGVRAAAAGGGSRVVFEFDPVVAGYEIDYIEGPVTEDGSGKEVQVQGAAVLQVRMLNAAGARVDGEKVVLTYTGPKRVAPTGSGGVVTEAVDTGDFEGQVTWAVGLRQKVPAISVSTLSGPSRLVIDVPAPK